jgi:hypothetical protein
MRTHDVDLGRSILYKDDHVEQEDKQDLREC